MNEEFTLCSSCGKQIPKYQFCIYCGHNRLKDKGRTLQASEQESPTIESPQPTTSFEPGPPNFSAPLIEGAGADDLELTRETTLKLIAASSRWTLEETLKYQIWRVKLCDIFSEQGMPTRVFTNIWEGYGNEVERLQRKIEENQSARKTNYEDKKAELENTELKLDELRVRVTIGEISESDLLIRTPSIRADIESLRHEVSRLEEHLSEEENIHSDVPPREMFEHEQSAKAFIAKIDGFMAEGKFSREFGTRLGTELEEVRAYFSSKVGDQGEQGLRNELDTLEVRYKVGEITMAEFDFLKREIVVKLERHWAN